MADYVTSAFLDAQTLITQKYTEHEQREREYPILATGLDNQDYVVDNVAQIKESAKRDVKGYQFKAMTSDNGTTRSHNFDGSQGDTMEVDLNWNTFSETMGKYMTVGKDNMMNNARILANQISQKQRLIRQRLGKALLQSLHAGRTTVANAVVRNASFDENIDAFLISNPDLFFAYLQSVMQQHDYKGGLDVLVDAVLAPKAKNIAAQGSSNANNMAWQLEGMNVMQHVDLGVNVGTDAFPNGGMAIALPENSFAYIPWIPSIYREGSGDFASYNGGYTTINDEVFGDKLTYALRGYSLRADGSANGGTTDDMKINFQLSVDVATQIAQLSEAGASPVYEFGLTA
jgi:hypothetical protein